jgi:hypothetical protein
VSGKASLSDFVAALDELGVKRSSPAVPNQPIKWLAQQWLSVDGINTVGAVDASGHVTFVFVISQRHPVKFEYYVNNPFYLT